MQYVLPSIFKCISDLAVLDVTFRILNIENNSLSEVSLSCICHILLFEILFQTTICYSAAVACYNAILPASVILGEHEKTNGEVARKA